VALGDVGCAAGAASAQVGPPANAGVICTLETRSFGRVAPPLAPSGGRGPQWPYRCRAAPATPN